LQHANTPLSERRVVRRGLIAGLAGLGAAALLQLSGNRVAEAGDGDPLTIGQSNSGSTSTVLTSSSTTGPAFRVSNGGPGWALGDGIQGMSQQSAGMAAGVRGDGFVVGVMGRSAENAGVVGRAGSFATSNLLSRPKIGVDGQTDLPGGIGVRGVSGANGIGVYGVSNASSFADDGNGSGTGVYGKSNSGLGVRGDSSTGVGVRGACQGGIGVQGVSDFQPGVEGSSFSSLGVRGLSTHSVAVVGISTNNHGLYGSTSSASSAGFVGENLAGGLAGYFAGNVRITGSLLVNGAKNAVIKMQDGTTASVYCQESPDPWFEDFGRAQLVAGVANVPLEREFATLVAGGDYMVFCFPEGPSGGLYVSRRGATSFEVRDPANGSISFTYRIVTRRKDIEGQRFARVTDEVGATLAAARAAVRVGGAPPSQPSSQNPVTPPPFVPNPPAPSPIQPIPTAPNNLVAPGPIKPNPDQPGIIGPR